MAAKAWSAATRRSRGSCSRRGSRCSWRVNKTDDKRARDSSMEFYQLGIDPVLEISAEHGTGVAELLDAIVERLGPRGSRLAAREDEKDDEVSESRGPSPERRLSSPEPRAETTVAIVGRPNVGKSSLVNRLLHAERVLVSDMPGTTRDAIDAPLTWHRRRFRIVDTAGMRRPGRVSRGGAVEMVSVAGAKKAIGDADVVALVIDASTGAADQDAAIGGEADRAGRGIVIIANKWDLVKDRGPEVLGGLRRGDAASDAVSRLRADPARLGDDWRTGAENPRDDRQDWRNAAQADTDAGAQQVHRRRSRTRTRRSARGASTCASCTRRRLASRRLRLCCSPTSPPTFHFSYERFLVNSCGSTSASSARRSASRSAAGRKSAKATGRLQRKEEA